MGYGSGTHVPLMESIVAEMVRAILAAAEAHNVMTVRKTKRVLFKLYIPA
jgi:hypothetical protein